MSNSKSFLKAKEIQLEQLGNGISRQILGYNEETMMVRVNFEKGAIGTLHTHPHSQSTFVVSGVFEVEIDGETAILSAEDGFFVAPDLIHGVKCLEAGTLIDSFTPCRTDFLNK